MRRSLRWALPCATAAILAATACGSTDSGTGAPPYVPSLSGGDFTVACQGQPVERARAYEQIAAEPHKVLFFSSVRDSGLVETTDDLPADWAAAPNPNGSAYAVVDVVICSERVSDKVAQKCDGYKVDGQPNPLVMNVMSSEYRISVHEARTGKELAGETVTVVDDACPTQLFSIPKDATTYNWHSSPDVEKIVALATPFVRPPPAS